MRTDINLLVQEAVLDRANPEGVFQNLVRVSKGQSTTNGTIQFRLNMLGLTHSMPTSLGDDSIAYLTPKGEHVLCQIRSKMAELEAAKPTE